MLFTIFLIVDGVVGVLGRCSRAREEKEEVKPGRMQVAEDVSLRQ